MSATVRHSSLGVPGSKRGAATVYVREREFANEEDFNQWFKDEKVNWRNPHTRDLSANKTEEYQCRYARMKNYRCSIKLRVLYPQDNFKVIVEQSKGSHDHVPVSQPKLSDQHKELMKQELDSTALIIQGKIQTNAASFQSNSSGCYLQVELARLSSYGLRIFGCGAALFATHLALVSNENTWCYERFFEAISALNYIPEIIMGDGDTTISAAAKNVWMLIKRAMCYAHVKMNLKKKLQPKVMDPVRETISKDVALLQLASPTAEFVNAAKLLKQEWDARYVGLPRVIEVCRYFARSWLDSDLNGWCEGFSRFASTNNGLESKNAVLKKITFRKKLGLAEFLQMAEKTINLFSVQPENQIPGVLPAISPSLYRNAYQLKQENRNILDVLAGGVRLQSYIIPSSSALNLSEEELGLMYNELQNNSFVDWKRYELILHSIRIVRPSTIWPSYDVCNCKEGMKKKLCKHSVMVMCANGKLCYPPDAKENLLQRKRKMGRPKLASRALSFS